MTVEELVDKLIKFDPKDTVFVYVKMGEDMDKAHDVVIQDNWRTACHM